MGAITFAKATPGGGQLAGGHGTPVIDNKRVVYGTITFSASYATSGDTLALNGANGPGMNELTQLYVDCHTALGNIAGLSILLGGTKTAPKIVAFDANGTEVSNGTNLSARAAIPVMLLGN